MLDVESKNVTTWLFQNYLFEQGIFWKVFVNEILIKTQPTDFYQILSNASQDKTRFI